MKILYAIAPGSIAGAEKSALASAEALRNAGEIIAFAVLGETRNPKCAEDFAALAREKEIPSRLFFASGRFDFDSCVALKRYYMRSGFDLIHSHSYKTLAYISLLRRNSPALVATYHGATSHTLVVHAYEWLEWSLFQGVDELFAVSAGALEGLSKKGPLRCPTAVIPNALSAVPQRDHRSKVLDLKAPVNLLFLGRLSKEKGADVLIDALGQMNGSNRFHLRIVGDGPERTALERKVRDRGLSDAVEFVGFVKKVETEFQRADVLTMPSRTEGLPMSLIEATSCGLPAVASRVGGVPDLINDGENGLLVRPEDSGELYAALTRIRRELIQFSQRAESMAARIAKKYSGAEWTKAAMKEYERVINETNSRRKHGG